MTFPSIRGDLQIRLDAIPVELAGEIIADGGIKSLEVNRYLGRTPSSYVLQDELDWLEKVRTQSDICAWGIYVRESTSEEEWKLIGTYSLNQLDGALYKTAVSGCILFNKDYWNKGIASSCHRMRTMYAVDYGAYVCVRSMVLAPNSNSDKAIRSVGYVPVSTVRNHSMVEGQLVHATNYEQINPAKWAWECWWGDDKVPKEFLAARSKTQAAIDWARNNIAF